MNPTHLLTFAVVARFKSITQAADYLHLGQPAVSGQLKLLQSYIGEPLYFRKGYQIELTPAGQGLLAYAQRMTDSFNQASEYVRCLQQVNAGTLRLGATTTIASYYLPKYLVQLQTMHAGVNIRMITADTDEILRNLEELDLGFIEGPTREQELSDNYQVIHWQEDEIVLVVPEDHAIARDYPEFVPLDVFIDNQIIWREPGSGARQAVEMLLAEYGMTPKVNIEVTGVSGIKEAVRAGLGIGFASSQSLRNERQGLVARRFNEPNGLIWHLKIVAPKRAIRSRATQAFLDLCL